MLVHLVDVASWRSACALGALTPRSLVQHGFVQLGRPDQMAVLAAAFLSGRDDVVVLVVDPARLTAEIEWEVPEGDGEPLEGIPRLYGSLPTSAVVATRSLRRASAGTVEPLGRLPSADDLAGRVRTWSHDAAVRRAPVVVTVPGGSVTLDPRLPRSYESNALHLLDERGSDDVVEVCDRWMGGAVACGPPRGR